MQIKHKNPKTLTASPLLIPVVANMSVYPKRGGGGSLNSTSISLYQLRNAEAVKEKNSSDFK